MPPHRCDESQLQLFWTADPPAAAPLLCGRATNDGMHSPQALHAAAPSTLGPQASVTSTLAYLHQGQPLAHASHHMQHRSCAAVPQRNSCRDYKPVATAFPCSSYSHAAQPSYILLSLSTLVAAATKADTSSATSLAAPPLMLLLPSIFLLLLL